MNPASPHIHALSSAQHNRSNFRSAAAPMSGAVLDVVLGLARGNGPTLPEGVKRLTAIVQQRRPSPEALAIGAAVVGGGALLLVLRRRARQAAAARIAEREAVVPAFHKLLSQRHSRARLDGERQLPSRCATPATVRTAPDVYIATSVFFVLGCTCAQGIGHPGRAHRRADGRQGHPRCQAGQRADGEGARARRGPAQHSTTRGGLPPPSPPVARLATAPRCITFTRLCGHRRRCPRRCAQGFTVFVAPSAPTLLFNSGCPLPAKGDSQGLLLFEGAVRGRVACQTIPSWSGAFSSRPSVLPCTQVLGLQHSLETSLQHAASASGERCVIMCARPPPAARMPSAFLPYLPPRPHAIHTRFTRDPHAFLTPCARAIASSMAPDTIGAFWTLPRSYHASNGPH